MDMLVNAWIVLLFLVNALGVNCIEIFSFEIIDKYGEPADIITDGDLILILPTSGSVASECYDMPKRELQFGGYYDRQTTEYYITAAGEYKGWHKYATKNCLDENPSNIIRSPMLEKPGEYLMGMGLYPSQKYTESQTFTIPEALIGDDHETCLKLSEFCDMDNGPWFYTKATTTDREHTEKMCKKVQKPQATTYAGKPYPREYLYCPINKGDLLESMSASYEQTVVKTSYNVCTDGLNIHFKYRGRTVSYAEPIPLMSANDESLLLFCPHRGVECEFSKEIPMAERQMWNPNKTRLFYKCQGRKDGYPVRIPAELANITWQILKIRCEFGRSESYYAKDFIEARLVIFGNLNVTRDPEKNISICQPVGEMRAPFRIDSIWWMHPEDPVVYQGSMKVLPRDDYTCRGMISAKLCVPYWRHVAEVSTAGGDATTAAPATQFSTRGGNAPLESISLLTVAAAFVVVMERQEGS